MPASVRPAGAGALSFIAALFLIAAWLVAYPDAIIDIIATLATFQRTIT
jgi:hypothetical protein